MRSVEEWRASTTGIKIRLNDGGARSDPLVVACRTALTLERSCSGTVRGQFLALETRLDTLQPAIKVKAKGKALLRFGSVEVTPAPARWRQPCANTECSLHQLSPYIGKIKSSIAGELVERFSKPGDLVVDPFAGAGTIPFEAALRGRRALGADISPYARILSKAKLSPPPSLDAALSLAERALQEAAQLPTPDLRVVPAWVRRFYHPDTLREALNFASICRRPGNEFLMACLLGILHHQRPGFLSYPSSHLVPYLRDRKYPRHQFPEMYAYRELRPRLLAKVRRSYKRFVSPRGSAVVGFKQTAVQNVVMPTRFGALITSPPYMNALDYGRDNRLRLWFIEPSLVDQVDNDVTARRQAFRSGFRHRRLAKLFSCSTSSPRRNARR